MKCPICELTSLENVIFKVTGQKGYLCESCGIIWFNEDRIVSNTGHPIEGFEDQYEYTLEKTYERDNDSESIGFSTYK